MMKDVEGRRHGQLRLPGARSKAVFEAELEGRKEQIARTARSTRDLPPLAHALVARQDLPIPAWLFAWGASIVLIVSFFALSAAWRKPRFEDERWRPLGAGALRGPCSAAGAGALRPRSASSCSGVAIYCRPARHRSARPQLRPDLPLRHLLARLPAVQRPLRRRLPAVQPLAGDRPGRWAAASPAIAGQRPAHLALPREAGPLAGGDRPARVRLAGGRLRLQRRRRRRPLARTPPASPPSSTAATRWR